MPSGSPEGMPRNYLLASLPPAELQRLQPRLMTVPLEDHQLLYGANAPVEYVYFPESGLISLLAHMEDGARVEAGMVGLEGMAGLCLFLDNVRSPFEVVVQIPGAAQRLSAADLRRAVRRANSLAPALRRYTDAFVTHLGQTAACNSRHNVEQRCCRWLLLAHDRIQQDKFPLTHEFLAAMLSVRRQGVTEVAGALQRAGLIEYRRGVVAIRDRGGLEAACCSCYQLLGRLHRTISV